MPPTPSSRFAIFPPDVALALSPARLRALRARFAGLDAVDETNAFAVARALCFRELPAATADALYDVAYFASDAGREAIFEAARALAIDLAPLRDLVPLAIALRLVRARAQSGPRGDRARAVLERARIRLARLLTTRVSYEHLTLARERPSRLEAILDAGRAVHGDAFVDGWIIDGRDGVLRAVVVHRGLPVETLVDDGGRVVARTRRPLACDVVRWDVASGRASFLLARPVLLADWTAAFDAACGGGSARPAFTLKSVHEGGAAWLAKVKLPRGTILLEVRACEVDDGTKFGAHGDGALAEMHRRLGGLGGYMFRATFRFQIAGRGAVDATIELPNKLFLSDPRLEPEIRAAFAALGVMDPGKIPDDLPSLAPFEQPAWRVVDVLGPEAFAWAMAEGILAPIKSHRPSDESFRRLGSMQSAHEVPGEEAFYGVAPNDWSVRSRDVTRASFTRCALRPAKLTSVLRAKLQLDEARVGELPDGVLAIGELRTKGGTIAFFLVLRAVREDEAVAFGKKIRDACTKAQHAVAIVARGRGTKCVAEVEVDAAMQVGFGELSEIVTRGAEAVHLVDAIEGWRWQTADKPLALLRETREIWLGKVRLRLTDNQVALFFALADEDGEWVRTPTLGSRISPNATIPDQIVRKAMLDLEERVRASAKEAGIALPEAWITGLIEEKRKTGYRIGLGYVVR